MRAVIQAVSSASVRVNGGEPRAIGPGLMILLGVKDGDDPAIIPKLAAKCAGLRIFADDEGKLNRSAVELGYSVLVVSNFTLYGDTSRGKRPSFIHAAKGVKSKQLKAVGKASIVPVAFAVNEPLLFGAPMILNPYMLIPFVAAGCVNVSVAKFFIDNVGMNGFSFVVPWATPAPIGIFITTNFQLIALVFVAIVILLDAIIYLPFLKAYDKLLCDQEAERAAELGLESDGAASVAANASTPAVEQATASVETTVAAADSKPVADQPKPAADASAKKDVDGLKVLVLCAGAGTSAMLANAIKEGAAQTGENIASSAGAYGQHTAIMDQYDVIVLAPQVRSYYNDMKADTDRLGIKLLAPRGKEYIDLTRDPAGAIKWLRENLD